MSAGAFLPPALQQAWEDLGVIVIQGYGSSETRVRDDQHARPTTASGRSGRPMPPVEMRLAEDGEVLFRGPTLFKGYWDDPEATARAIDDEGWYHSGDIGHLDPAGRLVLSGRTKDRIVLPNGFKVYPEDLENALRNAGIRDSVWSRPSRAGSRRWSSRRASPAAEGEAGGAGDGGAPLLEARVDAALKAANATLGPHQRIAGWRLWPEDDFPRTHTLKVKRDPVREWASGERQRAEQRAGGRGGRLASSTTGISLADGLERPPRSRAPARRRQFPGDQA